MNKFELNKIYHGDCLDVMKIFPEKSIHLTVTSPPYDNLRKYNGYAFKFEEIAKELYRITRDGGIVVWVVGDATIKGSETGTSFKQALYFKKIGFNLHDTMIYGKKNPIPQNHNRYEQCFEYMFIFSKGIPKIFNPLKEPTLNNGKILEWGGRKTVMDLNQCRRHCKNKLLKTNEFKNRTNIFYYSIGGGNTGHPAVFPEQLAEDQILSWSNENDVVLDCMAGSGTVCVMAKKNKRNYIGIEISQNYIDIINSRLNIFNVSRKRNPRASASG